MKKIFTLLSLCLLTLTSYAQEWLSAPISGKQYYIVLPYKPNISLIHSILYYKLFAYICKFLYLYNIILADIYA